MRYGYRESRRELFKELKILTLSSQYIFSLLLFVVNNKDYFVSNSLYHNFSTTRKNDTRLTLVSLAMFQNGVYYSGTRFLMVFARQLRTFSASLKNLKLL